jgi:hypothetical protein
MDIFKIFKHKCFSCNGTEYLSRVVHPGYHTTYTYYHQNCLDEILRNPEANQHCLDSAIQIMDQIKKDEDAKESKLRENFEKIQKVKKLSNVIPNDVIEEKIVDIKVKKTTKTDFINSKRSI